MRLRPFPALIATSVIFAACTDDATPNDDDIGDTSSSTDTATDTADTGTDTGEVPQLDVYGFANGCYAVRNGDSYLAQNGDGTAYAFGSDQAGAARFFMKASDLGTYLLYDQDGGYLVSDDGPLLRQTTLQSDILLVDDNYVSGAEWMPETSLVDWEQYQLRNRRNDKLLTETGLGDEGLPITFEAVADCREHPELTLDASGAVGKTTFDDGDLFGIVDAHSHVLSNFGFGGGGIFHGAPFHRLGVEHALSSCEQFHGVNGRKDFFGYAYDSAGSSDADLGALIPDLIKGELSFDNHITDGYPDFTQWPSGPSSSTHQVQYYKWLERAYLAGLRL
ncbi:MAG: hypothetical protein KC431_00900, partial [Myxococcales bacterium]|nr:hypothetical protein [Myxococcales bacterium]